MKKNAFTLIELLGVIIVLGLLAVLILPKVNSTLKDARKSTDETSAQALVREANNYYMTKKLAKEELNNCTYDFETEENSCRGFKFTGKIPETGRITIRKDGTVAMAVRFDDYCFVKEYEKDNIDAIDYNASTCGENSYVFTDFEAVPTIKISNEVIKTNSVEITFSASDTISGIKTIKCYYSTDDSYNLEGTIEDNKCILSNLNDGVKYNYKIEAENNNGLTSRIIRNVTTSEFGTITIAMNPSANEYTNSRTISLSGAGEGQTLQYQLGSSVNELNWTNYTESFSINTNTNLYIRITDGINLSDTETYTEDRIDVAPPTALASNGTTDWNINIALSDDRGLAGYAITQSTDEPTSWTSVSGTSNTINTTLAKGTYYIWVKDISDRVNSETIYLDEYKYNFQYSGNVQTFTIPYDGRYKLEVWGAQGGHADTVKSGDLGIGGKGGYSTGILSIDSGNTLYVYVGGKGSSQFGSSAKADGGFNGGGSSWSSSSGDPAGGGGGASDIRIGTDSLYARVIVAGGGGGGGEDSETGGYGGGTSGGATSGTAGTASSPSGYFGIGGHTNYDGGGGGGGWYGGKPTNGSTTPYTSNSTSDTSGSPGGSGYVYKSDTASNYPSGCLLNSDYYLDSASTIAGNTSFTSPSGSSETGHTGDGYARITYRGLTDTEPSACDDGISSLNGYIDFDYTGNVQEFNACPGRTYKLEVWGAQGGPGYTGGTGGYGGYSVGTLNLQTNTVLYIMVGQQGYAASSANSGGGYNGGGAVLSTCSSSSGGGGGATHIATRSGLLSELSSYQSNVIIVAGGGGALGYNGYSSYGGAGGGYIGANGQLAKYGMGGTQTSGGAAGSSSVGAGTFGQGGTGHGCAGGPGGGGWYGGGGGDWGSTSSHGGGGGGSGYINTSVLTNAEMYMYTTGCTSSTTPATKTTCTSNVSSTAESTKAKSGNGFARITYIGNN